MDGADDGAEQPDGGTRGSARGVQSVDRVVAILGVFSRERPVVGISELARRTGLTRGTTHRLVSSLSSHGLLTQVPDSVTYSLGPRLLSLAEQARDQLSLENQARPVMTRLRDTTGETVGLHILDGEPSRRTVAQVESLQALRRTYTDLGAPRPPHQGAPGKALLAHADPVLRRGALARLAATAPADAEQLAEELEQVVERGYAISLEERVAGVVAVAAPVWDHRGPVAALSVSAPAVRAGRDELEAMAPIVLAAARELSERLGRPPGPSDGPAEGGRAR